MSSFHRRCPSGYYELSTKNYYGVHVERKGKKNTGAKESKKETETESKRAGLFFVAFGVET